MDFITWGNKRLEDERKEQLLRYRRGALHRNNHCKLSAEAIAWLNGELLGDGCITARTTYTARFTYSSRYLKYIEYVAKTLNGFGIKQSGIISKRMGGFNTFVYDYTSCVYIELFLLRKLWYPEGKKVVPYTIQLTPITCRQWYIGDGSLLHSYRRRPFIKLATNAFSVEDVKWLVKQLWEIGIMATHQPSNNTIYISTYSTKDFLTYVGKCPVECYKYKWDYEKSSMKGVEEVVKKMPKQQVLKP